MIKTYQWLMLIFWHWVERLERKGPENRRPYPQGWPESRLEHPTRTHVTKVNYQE